MKPLEVMIAVDQLANTLLGGMSDETISAKAWRCRNKSRFWRVMRRVVDRLFWFDLDHCRTSFDAEAARDHLPKEYRRGHR